MEEPFWEQMNIFVCALERKNYWKPNPLKPLATSCCTLISNLMLDTSTSKDLILAGADEFWPLLIYFTIKIKPISTFSKYVILRAFQSKQILRTCFPISSPSSYIGGRRKLSLRMLII